MRFLLFPFVFIIIFGSPIDHDPYDSNPDVFTIDPDQPEQSNGSETQTPISISVALGNGDPTINTDFDTIDNSLASQTELAPAVTNEQMSQFPTLPDSMPLIPKYPKEKSCVRKVGKLQVLCKAVDVVGLTLFALLASHYFVTPMLERFRELVDEDVADRAGNLAGHAPNDQLEELEASIGRAREESEERERRGAEGEEEQVDEDDPDSNPELRSVKQSIQNLNKNHQAELQKAF